MRSRSLALLLAVVTVVAAGGMLFLSQNPAEAGTSCGECNNGNCIDAVNSKTCYHHGTVCATIREWCLVPE